jgi:hypothetical protein
MVHSTMAIPPKTYARIAGILYLIIAVVGGFSILYVPSVILAPGDAAKTAANLLANQGLFGLGVLADIVVMTTEIVLSAMLFVLFKPTSPTLSMIAMVSRLTMVLVMAINLLIYITPMLLLRDVDQGGLGIDQRQAAAQVLFEAHRYGIYIWDIFFGMHLAALGYLIVKSGYFPRLLGLAIVIGSLGYLLEGLLKVTFFENAALGTAVVVLLVVASVSELAFALWLLVRGPNIAAWEKKLAALPPV